MIKRREERYQQMKSRMIRMTDNTWEAARVKAGITPLSAIIRQLVERWLSTEYDIEMTTAPMKLHTIQLSDNMWEAAKEKAGEIPVSAIIRQLIETWLNEIEVIK